MLYYTLLYYTMLCYALGWARLCYAFFCTNLMGTEELTDSVSAQQPQ